MASGTPRKPARSGRKPMNHSRRRWLGQLLSPGWLEGGRAAGKKGARRREGLRLTPSVSSDIPEEILAARLTERIRRLEATIAERDHNERVPFFREPGDRAGARVQEPRTDRDERI